jgi:hypothetical protein
MKLELKSLKIHKDMSQETNCFSATLYCDGIKTAFVRNDGQGGPNVYDTFNDKKWKEFEKWAKAQPLEFDFEKEDQIIDTLMVQQDETRWIERQKKKGYTVYSLKGDAPGTFYIYKARGELISNGLKKHHGDKLNSIY